jgi:diaminohydroxyphosphoribosylaminopyrimidine deaminase/5-amino-6-(5-phosphoribosylamino)uracil reductase
MHQDVEYMRVALRAAQRGAGQTSPNPAVGAAIVRRGQVVAQGFHRRAGGPHAEIEALRALQNPALASGATIYVTLEPCSTHGRTPPCVEAIIAAGFRRVVIGAIDPNPAHAGQGVELLRTAGLEVATGILEEECRSLNRAFNHWIVSKTPLVIAKAAMSLDGRLTRPSGEGQWLTNAAARADAHRLRAQVDAILIGAETLRRDNPRLTVRGVRGARQPWRVVLTRTGRFPKDANLFTDEFRDRTLVYRGKSWRAVLHDLGRRQITSVLIEGGGAILGEAFDRRLVHRAHFYFAPLLCGGPVVAVGGLGAASTLASARIRDAVYEKFGDNLRLTGAVEY